MSWTWVSLYAAEHLPTLFPLDNLAVLPGEGGAGRCTLHLESTQTV